MLSAMGTPEGDGVGGFVLLDENFKASNPHMRNDPKS